MDDHTKEPIDLQKRRAEKLLEQERRRKEAEAMEKQTTWPGLRFREEAESIQFTEELLDRLKIMIRAIANKVKEAESIRDVERSCFGLALLILRDCDQDAYDRLFKLVSEKENNR